jgi:hypothetical protein
LLRAESVGARSTLIPRLLEKFRFPANEHDLPTRLVVSQREELPLGSSNIESI